MHEYHYISLRRAIPVHSMNSQTGESKRNIRTTISVTPLIVFPQVRTCDDHSTLRQSHIGMGIHTLISGQKHVYNLNMPSATLRHVYGTPVGHF